MLMLLAMTVLNEHISSNVNGMLVMCDNNVGNPLPEHIELGKESEDILQFQVCYFFT